MIDAVASQIESEASRLEVHRGRIRPLINQVLSAMSGSAQRVDTDMVDLLREATGSLDSAAAALNGAVRDVRNAEMYAPDDRSQSDWY